MSDAQLDDLADLIEAAVRHLDEDEQNPDTPTGWAAITRLQRRIDHATLSGAIALCESADGKRRRVGAAILGQLGHSIGSGGVFRSERFSALKHLVEGEARRGQDPEVLGDALVALGHLNDDRAIPIAVSLIGHSSAKVRDGVVTALSRHEDEAAIGGLIQLSSDSDDDIRDLATFGLGMLIDTDTESIRAALFARLTDNHPEVRVEAIAGLARRGNKSVIPALKIELSIAVAAPLFDAASDLADTELCDALTVAREAAHLWPDHVRISWQEALAACGCRPQPDLQDANGNGF